jgi:hypothetical protein
MVMSMVIGWIPYSSARCQGRVGFYCYIPSWLQRLLHDVKVDRVIEASRLAALVKDVSQVLGNLGLPPIPRIPQDPRTTGDVLGSVDVILERVKEGYDSSHGS